MAAIVTVYLLASIVGGLGTQAGPWFGALFVVVLNQVLRDVPEVQATANGLVIILAIRFAPRGIWGTARQFLGGRRDRLARH